MVLLGIISYILNSTQKLLIDNDVIFGNSDCAQTIDLVSIRRGKFVSVISTPF